MVKKTAMGRDLRRSIRKSMGRFLAIVAIIALGAGFLVGLQVTTPAMLATAQEYVDNQALFDLRILNPYGFTQEEVEALGQRPELRSAEGAVSMDLLMLPQGAEKEMAVRVMSMPQDINVPVVTKGRLPQKPGECLVDGLYFSEKALGTTLSVCESNEKDSLDWVKERELTIVGLCTSPLFMNFERGSTTVGNGALAAYVYVADGTLDTDGVYTEVFLKLEQDYTMYAPEYETFMEDWKEDLEPQVQELVQKRYDTLVQDASKELQDGWAEYTKGMNEYEAGHYKAVSQLRTGWRSLQDSKQLLDEQEKKLPEGQKAIDEAEKKLAEGEKALAENRVSLQEQKAKAYEELAKNEALLVDKRNQIQEGLRQLETGLPKLEDGIAQIDSGLQQIEQAEAPLEMSLNLARTALTSAQELLETVNQALEENPEDQNLLLTKAELETKIPELETQVADLEAKQAELTAQKQELETKKADLEAQRQDLVAKKQEAENGLAQVEDGFFGLKSARSQADDRFAAAEASVTAAQLELENGKKELENNRAALASGAQQLKEGRAQWQEGYMEFRKGLTEAMDQLGKGKRKLEGSQYLLETGAQKLQDMQSPEAFLLDRNTNVAYVCYESDSSIVESVGRVFPLFFFAVAALVCLTTMSKMVDEERTQMGVMKALGYSSWDISRKYLFYAGSASLLGCIIGVAFGAVVFPTVIFKGYQIMYQFSDKVKLILDPWQCAWICGGFTLCMLLVSWLCCRKELGEVPAELIRPKSPKAGKRLILERLPIWKHLSFLRKVAIRNIFRYKKRLIMMLVGVGGCTALLVTGLGFRDSIVDIASQQFSEVTLYDMAVTFGHGQDEAKQEAFQKAMAESCEDALFLHESMADMTAGGKTKTIQMIVTQDSMEGFVNLNREGTPVPMPQKGEALISNGLARNLELDVGDSLTLRTTNLEELTLTIGGIYDNIINNYVILSQDTAVEQWGHEAEKNTAYVTLLPDKDPYEAGALAGSQPDVVATLISQDMNNRIETMMTSMNYIVALIVLCAAALAFVVIYNLTNINITERVREIATIKVLGFYPMELAAYVFREGLALTAMGCIVGLGAGKLLLNFVIRNIRVDMVYFTPQASILTYLLAAVLTFVFFVLVDVLLYFKLEKINMAEALKSVE